MATFQSDSIGGGGFGGNLFGGGNGGIIEGLLLGTLLGNRNGGGFLGGNNGGSGDLDAAGIAAKVVELQNSSNLREQVANLGNDVSNSFNLQNLGIQAQFNQVDQAIAASTLTTALALKDAEINALKTANLLQTNIETLSTKNDAQFSATLQAINADGDATRALINANTMADLRDQLALERRRSDAREVEINITNSNAQSQNQLQAQLQNQNAFFASVISPLVEQVNSTRQGVINLGTMTGSATQASNSTNIR
jgi:hypothetical protein